MANIQEAISSLFTNFGFTYSFATGELNPTTGYSVAIDKEHEVVLSNIDRYGKKAIEDKVKEYTKKYADILMDHNRFIGTWVDDGKFYMDISQIVDTREEAERLCIERGQLAYYDNENKATIFINN